MAIPVKDFTFRIDHMLAAIAGIRLALTDKNTLDNWVLRSAVERGFEIISEASRHLPDEMKASEPAIPWKDIAGIGNILRHDYDGVQFRMLDHSARIDLPPLEAALMRMKQNL